MLQDLLPIGMAFYVIIIKVLLEVELNEKIISYTMPSCIKCLHYY